MNQTKPHPMQQFHDYLEQILTHGIRRRDRRTGEETLFIPGASLRFDMADGFPAITTKKLAFNSAKGELLGFFRGAQSAAEFRELGCKVWDGNANETPAWLANPHRKGVDDLGRSYGSQMVDWRDWRTAHSYDEAEQMERQGYTLLAFDKGRMTWVFRRGINQLEDAVRKIMTDPTNRRIMVTTWRPDELDQTALASCHFNYQFLVDTAAGELHLVLSQRSFDSALAFNITLGSLFLHIVAKMTGLRPRTMTQHIGDGHIYANHIEGVKEMLRREHYPQPQLVLGESIPVLTSADMIEGVFTRIEPDDITLEGYQHHPAIAFKMAV